MTVSMIMHNKDRITAHEKDDAPGMKNIIINKKKDKSMKRWCRFLPFGLKGRIVSKQIIARQ